MGEGEEEKEKKTRREEGEKEKEENNKEEEGAKNGEKQRDLLTY